MALSFFKCLDQPTSRVVHQKLGLRLRSDIFIAAQPENINLMVLRILAQLVRKHDDKDGEEAC